MKKICTLSIVAACALYFECAALGAEKSPAASGGNECNQDVWRYVHDSSRLKVLEECKMVSGRVASIGVPKLDGDYHINLILDPEYHRLLNDANVRRVRGALVVEIVCARRWPRLEAACKGCPYRFRKPHKGDRIRVWGSYVHDTKHGWMEIHPVMKLEILKNR